MKRRIAWIALFMVLLNSTPVLANKIDINYTPLMVSNMQPPIAVTAADGKNYLAYELRLTNGGGFEAKLKTLEVLNAEKQVIKTFSGDNLLKNVTVARKSTLDFKPGDTGFCWITFALDSSSIPAEISHRLTYVIEGTDKPDAPILNAEVVIDTEKVKVAQNELVIGPPLAGKGWVAVGGIGSDTGHRRALLSLNNKLCLSQRFANDWIKLDENNKTSNGDRRQCKSYPCYEQKIISVADGEVVDVVDQFEDQIPDKPGRIKIADAGGNYAIVKIGENKYAFYAHMKKGSIKVKIGDTLTRGQEIGLVGNAGNSSGPHLHFHVCDNASPLFANGVPFVIDQFNVQGKYKSEEEFFKADEQNKTQVIVDELKGKHEKQMPLAGLIVDFP
ncbi:MAG: M23 family metallopeptidase [Candidatus Melainabacteria bacterium]|nr:M23 family metallopeptidase [Candidatus Melainabacteria bacterium]